MQERRISISNALEWRLSCTNPSIYLHVMHNVWLIPYVTVRATVDVTKRWNWFWEVKFLLCSSYFNVYLIYMYLLAISNITCNWSPWKATNGVNLVVSLLIWWFILVFMWMQVHLSIQYCFRRGYKAIFFFYLYTAESGMMLWQTIALLWSVKYCFLPTSFPLSHKLK